MKTSLFLGTALTAMLVTGMASAAAKNFTVQADSGNELPAGSSSSALTADATFTIDADAKTLCGKITLNSTATPVTAIHIHKGDDTIPSGEIILTLPLPADGSKEININFKNLPADDATTVADTETYLNLHTETNPNGAARGQLATDDTATPCVGTAVDYQNQDADAGASSSSSSSSSSGSTGTGSDGGTSSGTSGTATPADSTDSGGCNTSGGSSGSTMAILAGLGLVVAAASRKRKKA